MSEQDWLESDDVETLVRQYIEDVVPWWAGAIPTMIKDRKLRLFACAVARRMYYPFEDSISCVEKAVEMGHPNHNFLDAANLAQGRFWLATRATRAAEIAAAVQHTATVAGIFRGIVGNPYRPIVMPTDICPRCYGQQLIDALAYNGEVEEIPCDMCSGVGHVYPWITSTVRDLTSTVYEERCADGTFDPIRLAVLSDALEEAECDIIPCPTDCVKINGVYQINSGGTPYDSGWQLCPTCHGGTGCVTHPFLVHLRAPEPRYLGDWVIDVLLGKA